MAWRYTGPTSSHLQKQEPSEVPIGTARDSKTRQIVFIIWLLSSEHDSCRTASSQPEAIEHIHKNESASLSCGAKTIHVGGRDHAGAHFQNWESGSFRRSSMTWLREAESRMTSPSTCRIATATLSLNSGLHTSLNTVEPFWVCRHAVTALQGFGMRSLSHKTMPALGDPENYGTVAV